MSNALYLSVMLLVGVLLGVAQGARAQALDYGKLEQLFGEPVTTSATGKPQRASEVPANMEIITQDDIRRSGVDNIPDILQFVTGLNFRRSSFNDGEVAIRGYDQPWNPRMLVLVNDRPVYEDFYGDVVWAAFPVQLDEIRQIEVIKGPNAALYGFNAASGVINIVTFDPLQDSANAVTLRGGTQSLKEGSAVTTVHAGDTVGVRMSGGGLQAHEFQNGNLPAQNTMGLLRPEYGILNVDSRWQATQDVQLTLEGNLGTMKRNFPADETPESDQTNTFRARLKANTGIGLADIDFYRTEWRINYLGSQAQQAVNTAYDLRASDLFKLGTDHTLRVSGEFKDNSATGQFLSNSTIGYDVYSIGAMWSWQITPALSLTNALRQDHLDLGISGQVLPVTGLTPHDFNHSVDATSVNSGLVWSVSPKDVLRFLVARGFQLPSLDDLAQQIVEPGNVVLIGSPGLKPTEVLNVELDYDRTFETIPAVLRSAVFAQRNSHLFGYDVSAPITLGPNTLFQSQNIGGSDEVGFEVGLRSSTLAPWRWRLSYQFSTIMDHINPADSVGVYSAFEGSTPTHEVIGGIGYSWNRLELDALGRWQSHYLDYRFTSGGYGPIAVSDYVTMNAHAGYRLLDNLSVGLTVEQFNAATIYERASVPVERRAFASATARF